jgi:hypothetical protein
MFLKKVPYDFTHNSGINKCFAKIAQKKGIIDHHSLCRNLEDVLSPQIETYYGLLKHFKSLLDPDNLINPGVYPLVGRITISGSNVSFISTSVLNIPNLAFPLT